MISVQSTTQQQRCSPGQLHLRQGLPVTLAPAVETVPRQHAWPSRTALSFQIGVSLASHMASTVLATWHITGELSNFNAAGPKNAPSIVHVHKQIGQHEYQYHLLLSRCSSSL
jgi:hypothetical protein